MASTEVQEAHEAAEEKVADILFGKDPEDTPDEEVVAEEAVEEEATEESEEEEYEPDPKPEPEGNESELVEFEYEGELLEATPKIRDALMRNQDYTQKTQEVSAQRKQIEVVQGELDQTREQFKFAAEIQPDVIKAQQLEEQAEQWHQYLKDNIESLSHTDIEKVRLQIDENRRERDGIVESLKNKQQEFQQASQQALEELRNKGTEVLRSRIPSWGEDAQKQVRTYALEAGFSEQEIQSVLDPRQVEVLWKASQFDALQEGKTAAVQKVKQAPSIKAKSRNPMPKATQDKLNLRKKLKAKNLSNQDKADLIGGRLADKFGM